MAGPGRSIVVGLLLAVLLSGSAVGLLTPPTLEMGSVWRTEIVSLDADGGALVKPGIAVGPDGTVFATWFAGSIPYLGELRESVWTVTQLNTTGRSPSVAIDAAGNPHVMYGGGDYNEWDYQYVDLVHAWRDAMGWHYETVDTTSDVGWFSDIVIDADGRIHVAYSGIGAQSVYYAIKDASGWHRDLVRTGASWIYDLDVGPDGVPHLMLRPTYGPSMGVLHMYKPAGGAWITEYLNDGFDPSIAVDSLGHLHVAYSKGERLMYSYFDGTTWSTEVADPGPAARQTTIDVDSQNRPHISHEQWINVANPNDLCCGHVLYATKRADGTWLTSTVDHEGLQRGNQVVIDSHDVPRIVYYYFRGQVVSANTVLNYDLRYAEPLLATPSRLT